MREGKDRCITPRRCVGVRKAVRQSHAILGVVGRAVIINVQRDVEGAGGEAGAIQGEGDGLAGGGIRGAGGAGEVGEVHDIDVYGVADHGGAGADDPDFVAARSDGSGDGQRDRTTCTCGGG